MQSMVRGISCKMGGGGVYNVLQGEKGVIRELKQRRF